jgi:hypothetical protein
MMEAFNFLQLAAILSHTAIIVYRCGKPSLFRHKRELLGTAIQLFLIFQLIKDMSSEYLVNKEWQWYLLDFSLALYFLMNTKSAKCNETE